MFPDNFHRKIPNENLDNCHEEKLKSWACADIIWYRVILTIIGHLILLPHSIYTVLFWAAGASLTAGYHRLWAHKAYKANLPLQILWMLLSSTAAQGDAMYWCKLHRMHHKFSETDADPHDARRGFFYSHMGWFHLKEKEEFKLKAHLIDMSDLEANPVVKFQEKYVVPLMLVLTVFIPLFVPILFWGESWWVSVNVLWLKWTVLLHCSFSVNSFAHLYGMKPYDKNIAAVESKIATIMSSGEGFHNFHHTFPQDYRASEFTSCGFNLAKIAIDFFSLIGWAYDLKTTPLHVVQKRKQRTGSNIKNKDTTCERCEK